MQFTLHKRAIAQVAVAVGIVVASAIGGAVVAASVIQFTPRLSHLENRVAYLGDVLVQQSILITQMEASCRAE